MDPAVALTQAYLRLNGYFTETEYPIIALRGGDPVTLTDLDILALRFPDAQHWVPSGLHGAAFSPDPILDVSTKRIDMIIGEVKEGKGSLNPAATRREVIEAVLRRFGCCGHDPAHAIDAIIEGRKAETSLPTGLGCRLRVIVFSGSGEADLSRYRVISLQHAAHFISSLLEQRDGLLHHAQFKDNALGFLALLHKLGGRI